jgi:hypothetical protein
VKRNCDSEKENTETGSQSWAKDKIINVARTVLPQCCSLLLILDKVLSNLKCIHNVSAIRIIRLGSAPDAGGIIFEKYTQRFLHDNVDPAQILVGDYISSTNFHRIQWNNSLVQKQPDSSSKTQNREILWHEYDQRCQSVDYSITSATPIDPFSIAILPIRIAPISRGPIRIRIKVGDIE